MEQHQLGDTNVDPDSQTAVVKHVVDLQRTETPKDFTSRRSRGINIQTVHKTDRQRLM